MTNFVKWKSSSSSNYTFTNGSQAKSFDDEDEEDRDKFLEISLSDATKVGDGMGSYMVYKITTKVSLYQM